MQSLNSNLENPAGINALDLTGSKAAPEDFIKAEELIKINFGCEFQPEKFTTLWELILEEGWSKERLNQTVKYFLKNKKYATWTIADWFDYTIKLYPYSWYLNQIHQFGNAANSAIERYRIQGTVLYRYYDGNILPFEYLGVIG
ncbi:MAG: hypothetical protein ACYCVH_12815 [Ignavibacteriaceae bacterium]